MVKQTVPMKPTPYGASALTPTIRADQEPPRALDSRRAAGRANTTPPCASPVRRRAWRPSRSIGAPTKMI
jgi:hypothetical protein